MKRALIAGITGQDGSYFAELLLSKKGDDLYVILSGKVKIQLESIVPHCTVSSFRCGVSV